MLEVIVGRRLCCGVLDEDLHSRCVILQHEQLLIWIVLSLEEGLEVVEQSGLAFRVTLGALLALRDVRSLVALH